jgi:hypothetical protein
MNRLINLAFLFLLVFQACDPPTENQEVTQNTKNLWQQ